VNEAESASSKVHLLREQAATAQAASARLTQERRRKLILVNPTGGITHRTVCPS
jgi:hypothetical protein